MKNIVLEDETAALARAGCRKGNSTFYIPKDDNENQKQKPRGASAERHSFLQYALFNFREALEKYNVSNVIGGSLRGTLRLLQYLRGKRVKRELHWTWKELTDMVKYSPFPIVNSLLKLENDSENRLAVDTFSAIMRYMGDLPLGHQQTNVECVFSLLVICHHHPEIRDEVYCQLMKQTTNNKSLNPESCPLGWRLLAFVTAFFKCSDTLMPYLMKYLENAAQDDRRFEQATAKVCLQNLSQTTRYGGRRNVPTEVEISAVTRGETTRDQAYFLPGGFQQFLPTSTTTVVKDIAQMICQKLGIHSEPELNEFSLYCIVEGDSYTMPLEADEYILDLVAELQRNDNVFYLIFCRSVWHFPLRLDNELYIDIIFHQITPDYLEGFLLVISTGFPGLSVSKMNEISRIAALLHRSSGISSAPSELDIVYLLPKPALNLKQLTETQWRDKVALHWHDMTALDTTEAKAQCLDILQKWTLFGSCFFGIKMIENSDEKEDYILAVNKSGINILDMESHETLWRFSFLSAQFPKNFTESEDATFIDMELGNSVVKKCIRLQIDHAHEVSRLIHQYKLIQNDNKSNETKEKPRPLVMIKV